MQNNINFAVMKKTLDNTGLESFNEYILNYKESARAEGSKEYFHVDVVADAYQAGFKKGKNAGEKQFIENLIAERNETFMELATLIYISSKRVVDYIKSLNYSPISLHINLSPDKPSVIIAVPNDALLDDDFIDRAYEKLFEIRDSYEKISNKMLDIGYIGGDNIDETLLKLDGFGYAETIKK
jgi:hypothetical protein